MTPTPELIEAAARAIDPEVWAIWDAYSAVDRPLGWGPRYTKSINDAKRVLSAVLPMIERDTLERCAKVARVHANWCKAHSFGLGTIVAVEAADAIEADIRALVPKEASDG